MKKIDDLFFPPRTIKKGAVNVGSLSVKNYVPGLKSNALWHQLQIDTEISTSTYQMESTYF